MIPVKAIYKRKLRPLKKTFQKAIFLFSMLFITSSAKSLSEDTITGVWVVCDINFPSMNAAQNTELIASSKSMPMAVWKTSKEMSQNDALIMLVKEGL